MTKLTDPTIEPVSKLADGDPMYNVDISDLTDDLTGSDKKITYQSLRDQVSADNEVLADLGGSFGHISPDANKAFTDADGSPVAGFVFGWDVTAAQARQNSETMITLKQRCWDKLTGHRIFIRLSGVLRMDFALDNIHWTIVGTPISTGYGTVTYDAAAGTISRSSGSWITDGFVSTGAIKVVDPSNPDTNEIHMILTVTATLITVRSEGKDKAVQVSGTTTDATFTPLTGGERSALSLIGDHHASFILARYGKGHACITYGSGVNTWTSDWIPGGGSAGSAETYFNHALCAHGVEFHTPSGGCGLVVQDGNFGALHWVGSIRVSTLDAAFPAMFLYRCFAGVFQNVNTFQTIGDGIEAESCNGVRFECYIEKPGPGKRGLIWSGSGNQITGVIQQCPSYGIDIAGSGNDCSGLYLERNHYTGAPNDWNPEIRVTGKNNVFTGRLNNTSGLGLPVAVFGDRDATETTSFAGNRILPEGFDLRSIAKPYAKNRDTGVAYFSLEHCYNDRSDMIVFNATGVFPSNHELVDVDIDPVARTVTRTSGDWTTVYSAGDWIKLTRLGVSDGVYLIDSLTATVLTLDVVHAEELRGTNTTGTADFVRGQFMKSPLKRLTSITFTNATSIISRAADSWITDGYKVGGLAFVSGPNAGLNAGTHLISAITALNLTVLSTLVDDGPISIDMHDVTPGASPNNLNFWWDGSLFRFYIPPNAMDRSRLVRIFDRLDPASVPGQRTAWVGLPIKTGDRIYGRFEISVDDSSWYVNRLPVALDADHYTTHMSLTGIGLSRQNSFTFGPGVHKNSGYFEATASDVIAQTDIQLLVAHQSGDGTEDGISDGGNSSSTRLHDTTGTPFANAAIDDWVWNITEGVYVRVTAVVNDNEIDTDAVTNWSGDTYNFGINTPIVGTIHKFELAVG